MCADKNQESPVISDSHNPTRTEPDPTPPPPNPSHRTHATNGRTGSERQRHGSRSRPSRELKEKDIDKLVMETMALIRTLVDK